MTLSTQIEIRGGREKMCFCNTHTHTIYVDICIYVERSSTKSKKGSDTKKNVTTSVISIPPTNHYIASYLDPPDLPPAQN